MTRVRTVGPLAALLLATLSAGAQELEFVEPVGLTVRGTVPVRVDMGATYQNGFVTFFIGEAGKPLGFKMATIADPAGLYGFDWDTQARDAKIADGEYKILAVGHNAVGEVVGQKAITVEVQNAVTASSLPARGIQLRYNLTPGREAKFVGRARMAVEPGKGTEGNDVSMFNGLVSAFWNQRVLWRNPDGKAQVRNSIYHLSEQGARGGTDPLPASGRFLSVMMRPNGEMLQRTEQADIRFPFAELQIEFPIEPVKIGDSWRSELSFMLDPRTLRQDTVIATHTLSGVEWHAGYRAAVIDSTFSGGPYIVELKGEDTEDEEWLATVTMLVKGTRRTYFAYQPEVGKVLRTDERLEEFCMLELEEPPPMAEMGMGMGGEMGMDPGFMEGAPVLGGAVPGAGVPGAVGLGGEMGMQQQAEKPAGFEKGGRAFRKVGGSTSVVGMEATGEVMGMEPPPPPEVDVVQFKRNIQTRVYQDFLEPLD